MEEYVDFDFTYFNLDTEQVEVVTHSIPLEVAKYIEDMSDTININMMEYYGLKAKLEMLSYSLRPENQN
jgi:hypothetical protein